MEACVGSWIIYYEPRKLADTRGYFAVAKVQEVIPDLAKQGMYFALIQPGTYLDFAHPVAFTSDDGVVERGVLNDAGRISGRAQSAVRPISPTDFQRILDLGLDEAALLLPRNATDPISFDDNEQVPFEYEHDRLRVSQLTSRIVRDRVFRRVVLNAYDERCAFSGLKLINGGGRAEVAAAHIRPVEANGPDIVTNGLALSGTAHWMFDRGLFGISDDLEIIISRHVNDQDAVRALINRTGRLLAPRRPRDRPHPHFLGWHREHCFKQ